MSNINLIEEDLWDHYSGLPNPIWYHDTNELNDGMNKIPCKLDHNGECLICDCYIDECAYDRFINKNYKYETKEELEELFKDHKHVKTKN
jgi:hypothetical protein